MSTSVFEQINQMSPLQAALEYARMGWAVIPLHSIEGGRCTCSKPSCSSPGKHPRLWDGLKGASKDIATIEGWANQWPTMNLGILTGAESGVIALDLDRKANIDGEESYRQLVLSKGGHSPTLEALTGSGGKHLLFSYPGMPVKNSAGQLGRGVDVRGDSGFIVVSPSIHATGRKYKWTSFSESLAQPPVWLTNPPKSKSAPIQAPSQDVSEKVYGEGKRNAGLISEAGVLRNRGLGREAMETTLLALNDSICEPPLDPDEVLRIVDQAMKWDIGSAPTSIKEVIKRLSFSDLADGYLSARGYRTGDGLVTLRFWRGDFYRWTGTHYKVLKLDEIQADVRSWLRTSAREKASNKVCDEVVADLRAQGMIPSDRVPPVRIDGKPHKADQITLQNGVLDIGGLITKQADPLAPHDPGLFSISCLPYSYVANASCPTWDSFLEQSQPEPEVRRHLLEWLGYNLVFDNSAETFAILYGRGAEGKSVICKVLRELVGPENCSSVSLEHFNPQRSFALASTIGKLSNVVTELNDVDRTAEGLLRSYVSGEPIHVERKYRDGQDCIPTARLTFATNILPRFTDRTDATWRRISLIPFYNQILDPKRQDKRLADPAFWRSSGELPGIFLKAVEGLRRYRERGCFLEPEVCRKAKEEFQADSNPHKSFILDYLEPCPEGEVETTSTYEAYREALTKAGYKPLAQSGFLKEVEQTISGSRRSKNAVRRNGSRQYVIQGVRRGGAPDTADIARDHFGSTLKTEIE